MKHIRPLTLMAAAMVVLVTFQSTFAMRDPLGYVDGMNTYQYVRSRPIIARDPYGLAEFVDIEDGRLEYSCNCGWIDWGHASRGVAQSLWQQISIGIHSDFTPTWSKNSNYRWVEFTLHLGSLPTGLKFSLINRYVVKYPLEFNAEGIALGIFQHAAERAEAAQSPDVSSFSQEDLPSFLIGFYRAIDPGISNRDIIKWCFPLGKLRSEQIWKEGGKPTSHKRNQWIGNTHWDPAIKDTPTVRSCCNGQPKAWPSELQSIKYIPENAGGAWKHIGGGTSEY